MLSNLLFGLLLFVSILRGDDHNHHDISSPQVTVHKAISVVLPNEEELYDHKNMVKGSVIFERSDTDITRIYGEITGLKKNSKFGFHVHEFGNISVNCLSTGAHYNPFNQYHGGPNDKIRHVGDLGNIVSDKYGVANFEFFDPMIKLNGDDNVIGRSIVVHEDPDDLKTDPTGNSGDRIACGVIGIAKECMIDYYTPSPIYIPPPNNGDNDHYQNSCIAFILQRGSVREEIRFLVNGNRLMDVFNFGCPRWEIRPAFGFGCDGECFSIKYIDNNKFLSNDIDSFNFNLSPKINGDKELWFIQSAPRNNGIQLINKENDKLLCVISTSVGDVGLESFDTGLCDWDINQTL